MWIPESSITRSLQFEHPGVSASKSNQLLMISLFGDPTLFQNHDAVRHAYGGEPVRDQQRHLAAGQFGETLEHFVLGAGVQRGGGLVENQKLSIAKVSARQRDFLPLATREVHAAFKAAPQQLLVAARQL